MLPETTTYLVPVYAVYALVSVALTVWLARTLFKNGAGLPEREAASPGSNREPKTAAAITPTASSRDLMCRLSLTAVPLSLRTVTNEERRYFKSGYACSEVDI